MRLRPKSAYQGFLSFLPSFRQSHHRHKKPLRARSDTLPYASTCLITVVSQANSCQLLNDISMVGCCVLTHTPHEFDITTAFIEEVEKVERKQCDNIHS